MSAQPARVIPLNQKSAAATAPAGIRYVTPLARESFRIEGVGGQPAIERSTAAVESLLAEALDALEKGNLADSARLLEQSLRNSPDHTETLLTLGYLRHQEGSLDEASDLYRRAALSDSAAWQPRFNQALILEAQGETAEAMSILTLACAIAPTEPAPLFRLAWLLESSGCDEEAIYWYQRTTAAAPNHHEAWLRLGQLHMRMGRCAEAISSLDRAMGHQPFVAQASYHVGLCHLQLAQPEQAQKAFEAACSADPNATDSLLALAALALEQGDLDSAERHDRAVRAQGQVSAPLSFRLAQAWQACGEHELARLHFRRAVQADPSLAVGYFGVQSHS
ncbi:tetratricopeptide repeat protein [uncultured Paludibaculum sp.]|uniref:tetratricopeptide repeat protein n=1 Tax=uncultured Paludibaculum sp. TaxID=1765020 RepID=UPI002AAC2AC3|nr:tetratricopeptide repeat protein [uncultured Paludibaculum sp.]